MRREKLQMMQRAVAQFWMHDDQLLILLMSIVLCSAMCFLSVLSLCMTIVSAVGEQEEEEAECTSFLLAPASYNSRITTALWNLGKRESWFRLSCIHHWNISCIGIEAPFCTTVFRWLPFFLFLLHVSSCCHSD